MLAEGFEDLGPCQTLRAFQLVVKGTLTWKPEWSPGLKLCFQSHTEDNDATQDRRYCMRRRYLDTPSCSIASILKDWLPGNSHYSLHLGHILTLPVLWGVKIIPSWNILLLISLATDGQHQPSLADSNTLRLQHSWDKQDLLNVGLEYCQKWRYAALRKKRM